MKQSLPPNQQRKYLQNNMSAFMEQSIEFLRNKTAQSYAFIVYISYFRNNIFQYNTEVVTRNVTASFE